MIRGNPKMTKYDFIEQERLRKFISRLLEVNDPETIAIVKDYLQGGDYPPNEKEAVDNPGRA